MVVTLFLTIVMMDEGRKVVEEYKFAHYDNHASCYIDFNRAAEYGKERAGVLHEALEYKFEYLKLECNY